MRFFYFFSLSILFFSFLVTFCSFQSPDWMHRSGVASKWNNKMFEERENKNDAKKIVYRKYFMSRMQNFDDTNFFLVTTRCSTLIAQRKKKCFVTDQNWKINSNKIKFNRKQTFGIFMKNITNTTHHFSLCLFSRSIDSWLRRYIKCNIRFDQRDCLLFQLDSLFRLFFCKFSTLLR